MIMRSISFTPAILKTLLLFLLWCPIDSVNSFQCSPAFPIRKRGRRLTLKTSTMREDFDLPKQQARTTTSTATVKEDKAWMEQIQSKEIQRVREELIQKFLAHGVTLDVAEKEVDNFLGDKNRSQNFVDMRKYAVEARSDELVESSALLLPGIALLFMGLFVTVIIEFIVKSR